MKNYKTLASLTLSLSLATGTSAVYLDGSVSKNSNTFVIKAQHFGDFVTSPSATASSTVAIAQGVQQSATTQVKPVIAIDMGNSIYQNVPFTANTDFEKYLATQLINANSEFSLKDYPEASNFDDVKSVLDKVVMQNPLILGYQQCSFNTGTMVMTIKYDDPSNVIKQKQQDIITKANNIISTIITPDMTDEQKRSAIYDYLSLNAHYDKAALSSSENTGLQTIDPQFIDSYTAYGVLIKQLGVCQSYAEAYQLLCDMVGINSIVVSGTLEGVSHAWNKVNIDGNWYNVDPTNNVTNSGIDRMLYNSSDNVAQRESYKADNQYWTANDISQFINTTNEKDYYILNGLEANSTADYDSKVASFLNSGSKSLTLRLVGSWDSGKIMSETKEAIDESSSGAYSLKFATAANYITMNKN